MIHCHPGPVKSGKVFKTQTMSSYNSTSMPELADKSRYLQTPNSAGQRCPAMGSASNCYSDFQAALFQAFFTAGQRSIADQR